MQRFLGVQLARRALERWRARTAVSDTIGAATGMVVLLTLVAGLLGLGEVLEAHTALSRAVNTAVQSEAQFGCWTDVTSETVAQTLQGGGVTPADVQVSRYTSQPAVYGNPTSATLVATIHIPVIGAVPLTVGASAPSQAAGAVTPACAPPNLVNPPTAAISPGAQINNISVNPVVPGEQVTLGGENFGTATGILTFTDGAYSWGSDQMSVSAWTNTAVTVIIPTNAPATAANQSATMTLTTSTGVQSAPFRVSVE